MLRSKYNRLAHHRESRSRNALDIVQLRANHGFDIWFSCCQTVKCALVSFAAAWFRSRVVPYEIATAQFGCIHDDK